MTDLHALTVHDLSRMIAARHLSALEVTDALITRCEGPAERVRAFATTTFDLARDMARAADAELAAGRRRGPLHGIPVGLKDAYDTAGVPTTVCSRLHADRVPGDDAEAWRRLRAEGAVLMGKLQCAELCLGAPGDDDFVPYARNPWDPCRTPGGSSSGAAAALAAGLLPAALGTDTGGSIRIPAAFCGVAGLKPTDGLVSLAGVFPLSPSLDQAGPMARTSRDCAYLLDAIAARENPQATASGFVAGLTERLDGLCVGYVGNFAEDGLVASEQRVATEAALAILGDLGAQVREVSLPDPWDFTICNMTIMMAEAFEFHGADLRRRAGEISRVTRARIAAGAFLRAEDCRRAQRTRRLLMRATAEAMEEVDVLVYPAALGDPPRIEDIKPLGYLEVPLITTPANVAGVPAASVRCGFSAAGMPMAFQVAGRRFGDATVLRVAHAFEAATPEFDRLAFYTELR